METGGERERGSFVDLSARVSVGDRANQQGQTLQQLPYNRLELSCQQHVLLYCSLTMDKLFSRGSFTDRMIFYKR